MRCHHRSALPARRSLLNLEQARTSKTDALSQLWEAHTSAVTHLHGLAVKKMDVRLLLVCTLADKQEEGGEVFFCVYGIAAKDGFESIALQLVLDGTQLSMCMGI